MAVAEVADHRGVLVMDEAVSEVWDGVLGLPEVLSWLLDASWAVLTSSVGVLLSRFVIG